MNEHSSPTTPLNRKSSVRAAMIRWMLLFLAVSAFGVGAVFVIFAALAQWLGVLSASA